jgi:hypothetical protein
MRLIVVLACLGVTSVAAQQPEPAPPPTDSARADSTPPPTDSVRADSTPPPPAPPTPEQVRYVLGIRSVGRGVAQLKDGVDRVVRTQAGKDTVRQRRAAQRLGGLCGAARSFLMSGRSSMRPTVYDPPTRDVAVRLSQQVDTLIAYTPTCESEARAAPKKVAQELTAKLTAFDTALKDFRIATAPPRPVDSLKTPSSQ